MTKEEVLTENYSSVVRRILLLVGIVMMSAWGFAADAHASKLLTFTVKNEPLPNVLKNIERNSDYNVIFSYDDLRDYRVTATVRKKTDTGKKRSKIRESYKVNLQHYEKKTINSIILRRSSYDEL